MPTKRRLSSSGLAPIPTNTAPLFKKPRIQVTEVLFALSDILESSESDLTDLQDGELVSYITTLQGAYQELAAELDVSQKELKKVNKAKKSGEQAPSMSVDDVKAKARKMADIMGKEIRKQMKWQPSCKRSGKRWTNSAMVPSTEVLNKLFRISDSKKAWKTKKIPLGDFENITGELTASIRYGELRVTSEQITLHWKPDEQSFSVSGLYGL